MTECDWTAPDALCLHGREAVSSRVRENLLSLFFSLSISFSWATLCSRVLGRLGVGVVSGTLCPSVVPDSCPFVSMLEHYVIVTETGKKSRAIVLLIQNVNKTTFAIIL